MIFNRSSASPLLLPVNKLLVLILLAGSPAFGDSTEVDAPALARLVKQDCGSCHGLTLKGGLGPDIRPESISQYGTATLSSVILDGIPGTAMPPWRPLLTEAEVDWIVAYLLSGEAK